MIIRNFLKQDSPISSSRTNPRVLLVIPHYRDTQRLQPFLDGLLNTFRENLAILVSDDGSGEADFLRLQELVFSRREQLVPSSAEKPVLLDPITAPENRGKGAAVHAGWASAASEYEVIAFTDADGAVSPAEILRALDYFFQNFDRVDLLVGSRVKMLGRKVNRRPVRHLSGRVFATLVTIISKLQVYDSQCGLKIMKRAVFTSIHPHCQSFGFAFDVELLLLAKKMGYQMEEFPVDWMDVRGSKVSVLKESIPMVMDILKTKRRVEKLRTDSNRLPEV